MKESMSDDDRLSPLLATLTVEQKVGLLTGEDFWSVPAQPAIGLRRMVLSDGPAGVRGERWDERDPSANVPSPTALAATWDVELVERVGRLLAGEARRKGVDVVLAPTVNLQRSPYGGRHFECFSEDPLLTARIGVAYVLGLQRAGVAATVKHFVANDAETERFTVDVRVDERTLRELYLAPFEAIVREARVWAVMAAYNSVNGTTMTEHPMLREILHREWEFDGVVMSDWFATRTSVEAGNAALDLVMPGPDGPWGDALLAAVLAGEVPEATLDDKVLRLLRLAQRVGALDAPAAPVPAAPVPMVDVGPELRRQERGQAPPPQAPASRLLRAAAAAGFVLARNSGELLPLRRDELRRVAVLGPNAAAARTLGGGSATVFPPYAISPLDGLRAALEPDIAVDHTVGTRLRNRVAAAPSTLVSDPENGRPGILVRLLAEDGSQVRSEHRGQAQLTWLGSFGPGVAAGAVATIEIAARLTALVDGEHLVGCSGIGHFRMTIDGVVRFDDTVAPPYGLAAHEGLLALPQWSTAVPLAAGARVDLVLRYDVPGGLDAAKIELNVEAPEAPAAEELVRAVELARAADIAIVVVGTTEEVESEGFDRVSLALPGRQDDLVRAVLDANPRTVVVVNSGAPVLLPWAADAPVVLLTWFPGQEFGAALADVLLGDVEPGGRLPVSWPAAEGAPVLSTRPVDGALAYTESVHIGYRGFLRAGVEPAFHFGHGLGYTCWQYEKMEISGSAVRVTVRNAGGRAGREVIQVYARRYGSAVERPALWLVGFAAVNAPAGEPVTAEIALPKRAFEHWDTETSAWSLEPGGFQLRAGRSVADLPLGISSWSPDPDAP
jgi:beta-glucosidase